MTLPLASGAGRVSVLVFTLNEAVNLPACLASLAWCDDVVVIDSFSTDGTEAICKASGARFFQHVFEGFGSQRNWALDHAGLAHDWVLILDADERVPRELAGELCRIAASDPAGIGAYKVRRRFHLWGRWLRHSSLYPTWVVRFIRLGRVRYENRGHAETQHVQGTIGSLDNDLIDENLKGIDDWFARQHRYATKDAEFEFEQAAGIRWSDLLARDAMVRRVGLKRIASRMPLRGLAYFLYTYVWRRGFLDGRDGLAFCRMRAMYQSEVALKLYDMQRRANAARATRID